MQGDYVARPTLVFNFEEVLSAEVLIWRVAPQLLAHYLMQLLSKGLRQTVCQRLHHDVVVVIALQARGIAQLHVCPIDQKHATS